MPAVSAGKVAALTAGTATINENIKTAVRAKQQLFILIFLRRGRTPAIIIIFYSLRNGGRTRSMEPLFLSAAGAGVVSTGAGGSDDPVFAGR